jgi:hypothetical protein
MLSHHAGLGTAGQLAFTPVNEWWEGILVMTVKQSPEKRGQILKEI